MKQYIERISNTPEKQERLINNAVEATKGATTEWSKDFWFGIYMCMALHALHTCAADKLHPLTHENNRE